MRAKRVAGVLLKLVLLTLSATMWASGPRWVSGPPYFSLDKQPLAWYTTHPLYFTDPADLSASVTHAAADALVARAAATWNVPQASLVLAQGGSLDEHVTGTALAVNGSQPVMPADVQSANYLNKQIAVIYDTDGSVIDALLGAGGSDPSGCLQNGVVESVDRFGVNSTIQHALLILNGRCTGPAPELELQMQYQLMRAFGRVLGVAWSQTNDNVFTQSPTPTHDQAMNWPVMHPIDVICGPYTYQCMPQPFTLRQDDISSMSQLYFIPQGAGAGMPGKQDSWTNGFQLQGEVFFPDGQGMEGVNVTVRRQEMYWDKAEAWQTASSVTGFQLRQQFPTALKGQNGSPMQSLGSYDPAIEGYYLMQNVSIPAGEPWQTLVIETEPVNPLYTGPYALSSYAANVSTIAPSGSNQLMATTIVSRYYIVWENFTPTDAVSSCRAAGDGTPYAPMAVPASGWWSGEMCGLQHIAWESLPVKANRSLTMEVTALDETGAATAVKMMPTMGAWHATDALGIAPTITSTPAALATGVIGMSAMTVQNPSAGTLRLALNDERGMGRPDFAYQARVLYADSISPANVGAAGGTVVISGMGFRAGNQVLVNGVQAAVTAVTATSITATAPALRALGTAAGLLATVKVLDVTTGGVSQMTSALGYGSPQERLNLVSVPAGSLAQGQEAATAFAVQVLGTDGVTPVAGEAVTFSVGTGYATFGACGAVSCTVQTDAQGMAQTTVTPTTAGTVRLKASTPVLSVVANLTVVAKPDSMTLVSSPTGVTTVGTAATAAFAIRVTAGDGVTPRVGASVAMSVTAGSARLEACASAVCSLMTDANGMASTAVTPLAAGAIRLNALSAAGTVMASFTAAPATIRLVSAPTGVTTVGATAGTMFAVKVVGGDGVTPVAGEPVVFSGMIGGASGGVQFGVCGGAACTVLTDAGGVAATAVSPRAAGGVVVSALAASGSVTAAFTAGVETMRVVSAPAGPVTVGTAAAASFAVRVIGADGGTPVAGEVVHFGTTAGAAVLGACGGSSCDVVTDATGLAATAVVPQSAGVVTLLAVSVAGSESATITGQALPNVLTVVSVPGGPLYVGDVATPGFAVQLLLADGKTPVAGQAVLFAVTSGAASFGACGGASCTVVTDAHGMASTTVSAAAAGMVTMTASATGGTQVIAQAATMTVLARERAVAATVPVEYVAEGTAVSWAVGVALSDNSASSAGVPVLWTGGAGITFAGGSSTAAGDGTATMQASAGALGAGVQARGTACAWGGVCGAIVAQGVSATEWQVQTLSGGGQQVAAGGALVPVVMQVRDASGHPVAGVPVQVHQAVTAWQQACPAEGRCTAPAVLGSATIMVRSDASGLVTISPMTISGAGVLQVTATAGTQGQVTAVLVVQP